MDEAHNYFQSRSGASPTPSGSSVSSPPSPNEPRLEIGEETRVRATIYITEQPSIAQMIQL